MKDLVRRTLAELLAIGEKARKQRETRARDTRNASGRETARVKRKEKSARQTVIETRDAVHKGIRYASNQVGDTGPDVAMQTPAFPVAWAYSWAIKPPPVPDGEGWYGFFRTW